jgi:hypothetical protein
LAVRQRSIARSTACFSALKTQLCLSAAPKPRAMSPTCTRGASPGVRRLHAAVMATLR